MFKVVVMEADLEILEKVEKGLDQKTLMFFLLFLKKKNCLVVADRKQNI